MSARQPFVPSGGAIRPASRAAPNKPSFNPDRSNPLHTDKPSDTPLNLQNLMKKKSHKSGSRRDDNTLPAFPRRLQTSTPNILSPRPVLPPQSMSPLFDPKAPSPSADPKETHISASFTSTESFASPDHSKFIQSQSGSRLPSKRSRNDFEDDHQGGGYPYDVAYANAKRYRLDDDENSKYANSNFSPSRMSSPLAPNYEPSPQARAFPRHRQVEEPQYEQQPLSQNNSQTQQQGGALNKLLGRDADLFVEEHTENYEILTEKWKNCTMDEWVAGADVIMGKYGKILDFVKGHMTTKLKLFATFDKHVDAHNVVLDDRAKVLNGVKQRLVKESGNILGAPKV
ncbi:hypothetical protein CPB85DRAFT_1322046 [Mucidula mucida]|nr:hypothetical protein CPB85DRAFT_1322046 [Mucidula mucida]